MRDTCSGTVSALVTWRFAACCGLELHPVGVLLVWRRFLRRCSTFGCWCLGFGRALRSRPVRGGHMFARARDLGLWCARVSARDSDLGPGIASNDGSRESASVDLLLRCFGVGSACGTSRTFWSLSGRFGGPVPRHANTARLRVGDWTNREHRDEVLAPSDGGFGGLRALRRHLKRELARANRRVLRSSTGC